MSAREVVSVAYTLLVDQVGPEGREELDRALEDPGDIWGRRERRAAAIQFGEVG